MKNIFIAALLLFGFSNFAIAQEEADTLSINFQEIENNLKYETGTIDFPNEKASITIPAGYKFLDAKQTQYVLTDLWGNMEDNTVLGSILPENKGVINDDSWMFVISYHDIGFVNDDDANDIDYDDLLKDLKKDVETENKQREELGFSKVELVGWASMPYYDESAKVLHWAKEIKFGEDEVNTLNYDLRVLGRKGMFNLSAVSSMSQLEEVKKSIPLITKSVVYNDGAKYSDFDSSTDEVAAWTIGGLVAGKVLAKTGFFALIAKFGKFIIVGLLGLFGVIRKFLFGDKEQKVSRNETSTIEEETKEENIS